LTCATELANALIPEPAASYFALKATAMPEIRIGTGREFLGVTLYERITGIVGLFEDIADVRMEAIRYHDDAAHELFFGRPIPFRHPLIAS
jgi:hypothetical protein